MAICIGLSLALLSSLAGVFAAPLLDSRAVTACPINPTSVAPPVQCSSADPPYTNFTEAALYQNIICPTTIGGLAAVTKPYLLVPGTGNSGAEAWQQGYVQLLGRNGTGMGYDVCYLAETGTYLLNDAQDTAEQIAYAINALATISGVKPIVQAHSQGNLDVQWVLTFWTSCVANTDRYISLAGDFRGTDLTGLVNLLGVIILGGGNGRRDLHAVDARSGGPIPLPAAVWQQLIGSNYLAALANHTGLVAKVPTTSIYSGNDEVVSPETTLPTATSYLAAGTNAPVGDHYIQTYCPLLQVGHATELWINVVYQIVKIAIASPSGYATPAAVAAANLTCNQSAAPGVPSAIGDASLAAAGAHTIADGYFTPQEPVLRPYAQT